MRASPFGLIYSYSLPTAHVHVATSSALTHPHPTNTEACVAYTTILFRALHGTPKPDIARELGSWEFRDADLRRRFEGCNVVEDWERRREDGIRSSGWVVDTFEAVCWAFFSTSNFAEGALRAVNLGEHPCNHYPSVKRHT
jgi:ADP-ribosyl-[dinitrogen reductase] hydrolase